MSEEEKKGPQWYHLFPPSIVIKSHIDIPDGWVDKIEEWCLKYGEYVEEGRLTTTYGSTHRPHSVPWIKEILDVIAQKMHLIILGFKSMIVVDLFLYIIILVM